MHNQLEVYYKILIIASLRATNISFKINVFIYCGDMTGIIIYVAAQLDRNITQTILRIKNFSPA